jgi:hypothetical protein
MTSIWLIADKGGTWWSCFESSKCPQCFKVLFFFFFRIFLSILLVEGKKKQTNKRKQKKDLKLLDSVSPLKVLPDQKMQMCKHTYLEELSIQFFCHKNTWKREELHLEELFSRYPPALRIQLFFCYLRHSDQPPDPSSASLMKKLCNLIAAVIVYAFVSSSLMFSYKCRGVSSAFSAFYEKARFVRTC